MSRTSSKKPKVSKTKKTSKSVVKQQNKHPHFVLDVHDSVMGQGSVILPKEMNNG